MFGLADPCTGRRPDPDPPPGTRAPEVAAVGGGDLAGQFADAGLLDELILYIAPVTLGAGRPLFPRRRDLTLLELAQNKAFACARYAVGPARA